MTALFTTTLDWLLAWVLGPALLVGSVWLVALLWRLAHALPRCNADMVLTERPFESPRQPSQRAETAGLRRPPLKAKKLRSSAT